MHDQNSPKPDAFAARMAQAQADGRPELAHQSLGRPLSDAEDQLAEALMAIYATGVLGSQEVADALQAQRVARPTTGAVDWTADTLAAELAALNRDLDDAYQHNGIGA